MPYYSTSLLTDPVGPLPLEKLAKISSTVDNYTLIFVPAKNDQINKSSLQIIVLFFHPH